MGRGRGKGKKVTAVPSTDDLVGGNSIVEAVVATHKRRGRPTKPLKDDLDEEVAEKIEREEDEDDVKVDSLTSKETTKAAAVATTENGRKRRRHLVVKKEKLPDVGLHEENGDDGGEKRFRFLVDGAGKANGNGCRPHGNRRKSKPRRAAEVGVECRLD